MSPPVPPKRRGALRKLAGRAYYRLRRYAHWAVRFPRYLLVRSEARLPFVVGRHATPLFRPLAKAERWLQENKVRNLECALPRLDGLLLPPGKAFSYWFLLGDPTRRKGYVPGMVLDEGRVAVGIGGGLCQLSNLLYWLTLHTPLTVEERWRHGYDVFPDAGRTQPFGSGATCFYPFLDLVIANRTDRTFQLAVRIEDGHLVGEWRSDQALGTSYRIEERDHSLVQGPWGGYVRQNRLVRIETRPDGSVREETVAENRAYMMYAPYLDRGERLDG